MKSQVLRKISLLCLIVTTGFATGGGCDLQDLFCALFNGGTPCDQQPPAGGTTSQPCPSPSWDDDDEGVGDGMSAATESDLNNMYLNLRGPFYRDPDPSIAHGTPQTGSLENGLNMPDSSHFEKTCGGYVHYPYPFNPDLPDSDDWGTASLIRVLELVSQTYGATYVRPRVQTGDMSQKGGGDFPGHTSHNNGLDVDIRYLSKNGVEGPLAFPNDSTNFDSAKTFYLLDLFKNRSNVVLILVDSRTHYPAIGKVQYDNPGHYHHFHVRIADPDGDN